MSETKKELDEWNEVCGSCQLTKGSHRADSICFNQCPEHEGRMDWNMAYITSFAPTGLYEQIELGTPRFKHE